MRRAHFAIVALAVIFALPGTGTAATVLGQLTLNGARIDGIEVPEGTTVLSPSRVRTSDLPAVVHLATGARLYLAPHSEARLAATEAGEVEIAAAAGLVQLGNSHGAVVTLAYTGLAVVGQEGDVELDEEQKVCVLKSPGGNTSEQCSANHTLEGCNWKKSRSDKLEEGDIYFVPADEDEKCSSNKGARTWLWAGLGFVGGLAAYDVYDDDDDSDLSPRLP